MCCEKGMKKFTNIKNVSFFEFQNGFFLWKIRNMVKFWIYRPSCAIILLRTFHLLCNLTWALPHWWTILKWTTSSREEARSLLIKHTEFIKRVTQSRISPNLAWSIWKRKKKKLCSTFLIKYLISNLINYSQIVY